MILYKAQGFSLVCLPVVQRLGFLSKTVKPAQRRGYFNTCTTARFKFVYQWHNGLDFSVLRPAQRRGLLISIPAQRQGSSLFTSGTTAWIFQ